MGPISPFGNLVVEYGYAGHPSSDWEAIGSGDIRGDMVSIDYKKAGYKTEAQMINAMGRAANAASGGNLYGPLGNLGTSIYCNSNCFNQNIAYRAGILTQIAAYNPPGANPGSGTKILPSPSSGGGSGGSISATQYTAFMGLYNAFTPTNQVQFSALQSVISSFGGRL
jgi:hypothetical protein